MSITWHEICQMSMMQNYNMPAEHKPSEHTNYAGVSPLFCMCRELTYYEKWARSLAIILKERGTIQQAELDAALGNNEDDLPAPRWTSSIYIGPCVSAHPRKATCGHLSWQVKPCNGVAGSATRMGHSNWL